jgi:hypothetical protein
MTAGRIHRLLAAGALATAVSVLAAGCGSSASNRTPDLAGVPLTGGAQVLTSVRRCDRGANPYCAVQLVIVDRHYRTSAVLLKAERDHLGALGWTATNADTGDEHAADSPGHTLRLTYAIAALELKDVDLGWIQRAGVIARTLSRAMFNRESALSLMLETGSS